MFLEAVTTGRYFSMFTSSPWNTPSSSSNSRRKQRTLSSVAMRRAGFRVLPSMVRTPGRLASKTSWVLLSAGFGAYELSRKKTAEHSILDVTHSPLQVHQRHPPEGAGFLPAGCVG